ncbi:hypothetical protein [Paenibacillus sp.]|uniref:hypothetical protein n=1 Tax=Paenibacillus sp. TaxID=58172 RepID=UPI003568C0C0
MGKYFTIKDIERKAKESQHSTFKGRANEAVLKIGQGFGLEYEKRIVESKRKTQEYAFSEDEKDLLAVLLSVSKLRPLSHGNKKWGNIRVEDILRYHRAIIQEIERLPDRLKLQLKADERYLQAEEILESIQRIHVLVDKVEFLFYMSPASLGIKYLHTIEDELKGLVDRMFREYTRSEEQWATNYFEHMQKEPGREEFEQRVKQQTEKKLESIVSGKDPEVHLLDDLIGAFLRKAYKENKTITET